MTLKFAIRDDDTNYFTDPQELEEPYGNLPKNIPISLGVVPFHGCTRTFAIPEDKWEGGDDTYPLDKNNELVKYLSKKVESGRYSIMLHGYDHVKVDGEPEFVAGDNLHRKIVEGKQYLEDVLSTDVNVFVPPNNSFSKEGLKAVKKSGMNTVYYPTPFGRPLSKEAIRITFKDLLFKYKHLEGSIHHFLRNAYKFWGQKERDIFMPVKPYTFTAQGVEEFNCVSMNRNDPVSPIKKQIRIAGDNHGKFCLALHYPAFRYDGFQSRFMDLINFAKDNFDTEFVSVDELFY